MTRDPAGAPAYLDPFDREVIAEALKNGIDWVIGSGELEEKVVAITAAVPGPERGRRGLQALRDTLSAVRASIVWGEPIAAGPEFAAQIAMLVRVLTVAAAAAAPPSMV